VRTAHGQDLRLAKKRFHRSASVKESFPGGPPSRQA
jgi:hypothetical protein